MYMGNFFLIFQIEIKGVGPKIGASGIIALDDISLYYGHCQRKFILFGTKLC